jgi:hypothetical protein
MNTTAESLVFAAAEGHHSTYGNAERNSGLGQATGLPAPRTFEPGTIITVRRPGHSRSPVPGQDYYAPALVLEQYMPNGELACFIFDYTSGVQYSGSYQIREISARGDGAAREMYETQSNIGTVLFDPHAIDHLYDSVSLLIQRIHQVMDRLDVLEAFMNEMKAPIASEPAPVATSSEPTKAKPSSVK